VRSCSPPFSFFSPFFTLFLDPPLSKDVHGPENTPVFPVGNAPTSLPDRGRGPSPSEKIEVHLGERTS